MVLVFIFVIISVVRVDRSETHKHQFSVHPVTLALVFMGNLTYQGWKGDFQNRGLRGNRGIVKNSVFWKLKRFFF